MLALLGGCGDNRREEHSGTNSDGVELMTTDKGRETAPESDKE
jgi:hypothetical protein